MADGTLKVGTITTSSGSGNITIGSGVTLNSNAPIFYGYLSSNQTVTSGTTTLVAIDTVEFDSNSNWDSSAYKWTPDEAGKYLVYGSVRCTGSTAVQISMSAIYKNGSEHAECQIDFRTANTDAVNGGNVFVQSVISMNGTSDYLQLYGRNLGTTIFNGDGDRRTFFGAYKLGA